MMLMPCIRAMSAAARLRQSSDSTDASATRRRLNGTSPPHFNKAAIFLFLSIAAPMLEAISPAGRRRPGTPHNGRVSILSRALRHDTPTHSCNAWLLRFFHALRADIMKAVYAVATATCLGESARTTPLRRTNRAPPRCRHAGNYLQREWRRF